MKLLSNLSHSDRSRAGMTLVEMMISVVIGTVIMGVAIMLLIFGGQTLAGLGNYDDMNRKSRNALDTMTRDVRTSLQLIGYTSNSTVQQLTFSNLPSYTPSTFSYSYTNTTGSNGILTRSYGTNNTVLLSNMVSLTFGLSQRNPSNNFTFFPALSVSAAKLIDVTWKCSLPIGGSRVGNSETVQSAKIVIRN
jgi:prepilin-type N-terminal cleavage/methylation domain-containing protein